MPERVFFVYIMASKPLGTLYIGVTNDLVRRVWEHKNKLIAGFTKKYDCTMLVYYEVFATVDEAIRREKQVKEWKRNWKLRQIIDRNPDWRDLYEEIAN